MSYIDVTGKTEEEAISRALMQLNMDRDDVSVEILERAKSGFLGIGSAPAKVRVTYGMQEETTVLQEKLPKEEIKLERPVKKPSAPKKVNMEKAMPKEEKAAVPAMSMTPPVSVADEINDEKADAIREFLTGLLEKMEINASIHIDLPEKGRYQVVLEGSDMGQVIGRRGETLDAIQQLTSYCVNRSGSGRIRVTLDAENYRAKREESLKHLALKVAGKVVKYRRSVTLEPMNAYERHIIHTALQEEPNVTTGSIGTDPNRRVVVSYDRNKGQ